MMAVRRLLILYSSLSSLLLLSVSASSFLRDERGGIFIDNDALLIDNAGNNPAVASEAQAFLSERDEGGEVPPVPPAEDSSSNYSDAAVEEVITDAPLNVQSVTGAPLATLILVSDAQALLRDRDGIMEDNNPGRYLGTDKMPQLQQQQTTTNNRLQSNGGGVGGSSSIYETVYENTASAIQTFLAARDGGPILLDLEKEEPKNEEQEVEDNEKEEGALVETSNTEKKNTTISRARIRGTLRKEMDSAKVVTSPSIHHQVKNTRKMMSGTTSVHPEHSFLIQAFLSQREGGPLLIDLTSGTEEVEDEKEEWRYTHHRVLEQQNRQKLQRRRHYRRRRTRGSGRTTIA